MATTKFLDYTGLSKLVEKIKNTYVNKNEQYEANLKWGGGNFANSFGPIDAAMIPELGANRFAFGNPKGITIEYSNDGGNTWKDYGASNGEKLALTSTTETALYLGNSSSAPPSILNKLRITFDTLPAKDGGIGCYTILNKFVICVGTSGMDNCYCTIQIAPYTEDIAYKDIATKVPISGSIGYNVINVPDFRTAQYSNHSDLPDYYRKIRFIFGADSIYANSYSNMFVSSIFAFGGVGWSTPSNMAANGHLYSYDYAQNATFPARVAATKFIGNLEGNSSTATQASKLSLPTIGSPTNPIYLNDGTPAACSHSLNADVPANAKFTDTTYTDLKGATTSANGTHGLVPAPTKADTNKFLKGNGTWGTPSAPTLSTDTVESILGGSTDSYSDCLDGNGLKIVINTLKALMGVIDISYDSTEIININGGGAYRASIKLSEEVADNFINNSNLKFLKFSDGCVFTRSGVCTDNIQYPTFNGIVVDQMQGYNNMAAWLSYDDTYYLNFCDVDANLVNVFVGSYGPDPSEIKATW